MRVESHKKKGMLLSVTTAEEPNSSERPRRVNTFVFSGLRRRRRQPWLECRGALLDRERSFTKHLTLLFLG